MVTRPVSVDAHSTICQQARRARPVRDGAAGGAEAGAGDGPSLSLPGAHVRPRAGGTERQNVGQGQVELESR